MTEFDPNRSFAVQRAELAVRDAAADVTRAERAFKAAQWNLVTAMEALAVAETAAKVKK